MSKVRLKITPSRIKRGKRGLVHSCPIALALLGVGVKNPTAGVRTIGGYLQDGSEFEIAMSRRMQEWVQAFDFCYTVKPTSFTVDIP